MGLLCDTMWVGQVPTVLYYTACRPCPVSPVQRMPLTPALLTQGVSMAARPAQTGHFTPLQLDELPAKGANTHCCFLLLSLRSTHIPEVDTHRQYLYLLSLSYVFVR